MLRVVAIITLSICLGFATFGTAANAEAPTPMELLGDLLYNDTGLSINGTQSCASCHTPATGFDDPDDHLPVSEGAISGLFGGRNAPSAAYAAFSPRFHWNAAEGLYVGGQFWDGRASSLADQASGPPVNSVEMGMPNHRRVVKAIVNGNPLYHELFQEVFGIDLVGIKLNHKNVEEVYTAMTKAIEAFEKTVAFTRFNSRYDMYLAGQERLNLWERWGEHLFNGKAKCNLCHVTDFTTAPNGVAVPPMLTDFTYDNLGLPRNPEIDMLSGPQAVDLGLGGRPDVAAADPMGEQKGKFKVMSLRNIADTAPYGHNGVFKTLEEIVHFYNTRDVLPLCSGGVEDPGFGKTCWAEAEYPDTVNTEELGNLKLKPWQEKALVAFLKTFSDQPEDVPSPFERPTIP